ncbi:MAG: tRNA (adenosine(37)-N6)-threonylcarbamoyltransferase complex dimerization subunit type 1 TsaB [Candidatus Omnitrophota bacterium]
MKILGIDTTTKFLCLGVYDNGRIYEYNLDVGRKLSALITPAIKRVVDALGWQIKDIDYFACGLGPGSFTGIRVGIAAIKGLALSLNKPVVGIPTLDILAANARTAGNYVMPIVDARRNLIYCGIYRNKSGKLTRITPYMLLTIDEFFKKIKVKGDVVMLGDAVNLYKQKILMRMGKATVLDKDYWYPAGHNIVNLAIDRIKAEKTDSAFGIKPVYLYPKECQIKNIRKI